MTGNAGEIRLRGAHVSVEPLSHSHGQGLKKASASGDLHQLWYTEVPSPEGMESEIERRLALRDAGSMIPFTLIAPDGTPLGMTTYMNIDEQVPKVEIGSTWIAASHQRSSVNTEAKYLLLTHAFEVLHCAVVEFRVHFMNLQSRRAVERLGAKLDGVLRAHKRLKNGTLRDTACYSIIASEWHSVKKNLEWKLSKS